MARGSRERAHPAGGGQGATGPSARAPRPRGCRTRPERAESQASGRQRSSRGPPELEARDVSTETGAIAPDARRRIEGTAADHRDESPETARPVLLECDIDLLPGLIAPEAATDRK